MLPATTETVVYVTPLDRIALVKTWSLRSGAAQTGTYSVGTRPAGTGKTFYFFSEPIDSFKIKLTEHWLVLEPGDELIGHGTQPDVELCVYGTLLRA